VQLLKLVKVHVKILDFVEDLGPAINLIEGFVNHFGVHFLAVTVLVTHSVFGKVLGPLVDFLGLCGDSREELFLPGQILLLGVLGVLDLHKLILGDDFIHVEHDRACRPLAPEFLVLETLRRKVKRCHFEELFEILREGVVPLIQVGDLVLNDFHDALSADQASFIVKLNVRWSYTQLE